MQSDRELLVLAARAAQIEIVDPIEKYVAQPGHFAGGYIRRNEKGGDSLWNPLTDDGDALRLVANLNLDVQFDGDIDGVAIFVGGQWDDAPDAVHEVYQRAKDCPAAMRRAITRAAAAIAETMKEPAP